MLGAWDVDAVPKVNCQEMLSDLCCSHAALLATMAPEGNLHIPFLVLQGNRDLRDNIEKHARDERPGDGSASWLAKYRGQVI